MEKVITVRKLKSVESLVPKVIADGKENSAIGGLIGQAMHAKIKYCGVKGGELEVISESYLYNSGGLIGCAMHAKIECCGVKGTELKDTSYCYSTKNTGGLVGYSYGSTIYACCFLAKSMVSNSWFSVSWRACRKL